MTTEEKAKAYDEALERARIWQNHLYETNDRNYADELNYIFPKLKESDSRDERIRKAILNYLTKMWGNCKDDVCGVHVEDAIDWLEKQGQEPKKVSIWKHWKSGICGNGESKPIYLIKNGDIYSISSCLGFECDYIELSELDNLMLEKQDEQELIFNADDWYVSKVDGKIHNAKFVEKQSEQKPTDKPKFKVGDWITDGHLTCKVLGVTCKSYELHLYNDGYCHFETDILSVNKYYRLWSIKDAKDGDVLWHSDSASNGIFIFKEIRHDGKVLCYCDYDSEDHFCTGEHHTCCWSNAKYIKPATKEQRDLLFEKMKNAGYEWDVEKKELKEIEPKMLTK